MPIFDFECKCGEVFEAIVKTGSEDIPHCPRCESEEVKQKIGTIKAYRINGDNGASHSPKGFNCSRLK